MGKGGEKMSGSKGDGFLEGLLVGSRSLKQCLLAGRVFLCPQPAALLLCPASALLPPLGYDAVSVFSPSLDIIF